MEKKGRRREKKGGKTFLGDKDFQIPASTPVISIN